MPRRDPSGRMQVRFVGSNISKTQRISAMLVSLEAREALSSSGVHSNRNIGLINGLNGFKIPRSCA